MPHVAVNLIYVGWENFTSDDVEAVSAATWATRQVYWQIGFDMFGFDAYSITAAEAMGYSYIDDDTEANFLTGGWTIPGNAVDVFLVKGYAGPVAGLSPVNGPCDKYLTYPWMTGAVVEVLGAATNSIMPHEIGHYLGLDHEENDPSNLMYPSADRGGFTTVPLLNFGQSIKIAQHCFTTLP
jgi:hypothetical protein